MPCDNCEIKNIIYQYADHIDRGNLRGAAALFRHGKVIASDDQGQENEIIGEQAVYALFSAFTRLYPDNGTPHTMHMTSNVRVEVDANGDTAGAQAYATVFQAVGEFPLQPIIGVRYQDRFEKVAQGWRFTERRIESQLFGNLGHHLLRPV